MSSFSRKKFLGRKKINLTSVWKARIILLVLGLILLFPGLFLSQPPKGRPFEANSFISEPVKVESGLLREKAQGDLPVRIVIPSVEIDVAVRPARIVNGYWELFDDVAGFGQGSAYPGEVGNTVIFAHTRSGLFINLKNIKKGEGVYVITKDKWFSYQVDKITEVLPSQTEVIAPTPDETLTLYTCSGFADSKRLIVTAKRSLSF